MQTNLGDVLQLMIKTSWYASVNDKNQLVCHRRLHVDIIIPGSELRDVAVTADVGSNRLSAKVAAGRRFFNLGTFPNDPACFFSTQIIPIP